MFSVVCPARTEDWTFTAADCTSGQPHYWKYQCCAVAFLVNVIAVSIVYTSPLGTQTSSISLYSRSKNVVPIDCQYHYR